MKRFMILATAALLSSGAFAQTAMVELAPEQRTKIKQYVTTQKIAPSDREGTGDGGRNTSGGRATEPGSGRLGSERVEVSVHLLRQQRVLRGTKHA